MCCVLCGGLCGERQAEPGAGEQCAAVQIHTILIIIICIIIISITVLLLLLVVLLLFIL